MKQILKCCLILSWSVTQIQTDDAQVKPAKKAALEIVASISDDIATLVINHHYAKDPEVAKASSIKLVTTLADAIACVIAKIQEKKETRSVELYSDEEYAQALIILSDQLVQKIRIQDML